MIKNKIKSEEILDQDIFDLVEERNLIHEVLKNISTDALIDELKTSGLYDIDPDLLLEKLSDKELIDEILERNIEDDILKKLNDSSLIEEFKERSLEDDILCNVNDDDLVGMVRDRSLEYEFEDEFKNKKLYIKDVKYVLSIVDAIENNRSKNIPLDCYEITRHLNQIIDDME